MEHAQHGGALDSAIATYGGNKADWLDLSTGINPNPYPVPAIPQDLWHRLPDEKAIGDCLAAARNYYGVPSLLDIVAGPGTQALIQLLPSVTKARKVWIVGPTYNEYERVFGDVAEIIVAPNLPNVIEDIDLVIVGIPNNPDGRLFDVNEILALGKQMHRRGGFVLVDAAFGDVMTADQQLPQLKTDTDGLVVFRSFGKFFGLAGLRLGIAIGPEHIISRFRAGLGPWAVSGPALFVGEKAMGDESWISATRSQLSTRRMSLEKLLVANGMAIVGATDLFVTASRSDSVFLAKSLAQKQILVRSFSYNPDWLRFGLPANDTDFNRLEIALAQVA